MTWMSRGEEDDYVLSRIIRVVVVFIRKGYTQHGLRGDSLQQDKRVVMQIKVLLFLNFDPGIGLLFGQWRKKEVR